MRDRSLYVAVCRDCGGFVEAHTSSNEPNHCVDRDRMILLQRYQSLEAQMTYLNLLGVLHGLPEHAGDLIAKAQGAVDRLWSSMTKEQKKDTEELLIALDIFNLHRPRRVRK